MPKVIESDELQIKRIKNGDEYAARIIYQKYSKAMFNILLRLTGSHEDANDLLQESFIKAYKNIASFRGKSTFGAWLKRIVVNTGLEYLRKKKIVFESIEPELELHLTEATEDETGLELEAEKIYTAIERLPQGSRTVLTLFLLENYSHKEIAAMLNISVSTSKTQYLRARKLLQETLKTHLHGN